MPGSIIQLPGTPNAGDPSTGFQFVIESGETGWYHTNGLPYWLASYQVGEMLAWTFQNTGSSMMKNLKFHFSDALPSYPFYSNAPLASQSWSTSSITTREKAVHERTLTEAQNLVDITFEQTNNPNQHGVVNFVLASGLDNPRGTLPIFSPSSTEYHSHDMFIPFVKSIDDSILSMTPEYQNNYIRDYSSTANHELGHVLGLDHTFFNLKLPGSEDTKELTLMSYTAPNMSPYDSFQGYVPFTEMDTAALQFLYGPSKKVRTGNDTYVLDASKPNWLWDGIGADTIDGSSLQAPLTLSLQPGYWGYIGTQRGYGITAPGSVTVNYGSIFENIVGTSFNDTFSGNEANNRIEGGHGIDTLLLTHSRASYNLAKSQSGSWTSQDLSTGAYVRPVMTQEFYQLANGDWAHRFIGQADAPFDGNDGTDTLIGVERLRFKDSSLALDMGPGQAGEQAARLIGSAAGKESLKNKPLVGAVLALMDSGMSATEINQLIVDRGYLTALAGGSGNSDALKYVFNNVIGRMPTTQEMSDLLPLVNQNGLTWMLTSAANLPQTANQIDLVGLSDIGLSFI